MSLVVAAISLLTIFGATAPVFAEDMPPVVTPVPTATFDFSATSPANQSFVVAYDAAMSTTEAQDPAHYFYTNTNPALTRADLNGAATITYDPLTYKATVVITDPTLQILDERAAFGVRHVHTLLGDAEVLETTTVPVVRTAPGQPGVPTISSGTSKQIVWVWTEATDGGDYPSGIAYYRYELLKDGGVIAAGRTDGADLSLTTEVIDDGTYSLRLWAVDNAGLESEPVTSNTVTFDTIGPDVTILDPVYDGNTAQLDVQDNGDIIIYSWTTTESSSTIAISDPGIRNPFVTIYMDGAYTITLTVTDAYGNQTTKTVTITYFAPYVPGSGEPIGPIWTDPVQFDNKVMESETATTTRSSDILAQAAFTESPAITSQVTAPLTSNTVVEPAAIMDTTPSFIAPTSQGWRILGILWYWWLLAAAIVVTAGLWYSTVLRARRAEDM